MVLALLMLTVTVWGGGVKVRAEGGSGGSIDYTFDAGSKSWGLDFGSDKDAYSRWQTFTMPEDGVIQSVEVWLIKRADADGNTADLTASVYSVANGLPDAELGKVTIPGADVTHKGITAIDLSCAGELKSGTQYALVLTTDPLADNLERTNGRYDWVSDQGVAENAAKNESAGQVGVRGTRAESVGAMYLKVNYAKAGPVDKSIDYTFDAGQNTWGLDFGNEKDAWKRWQSFTMPESGALKSADIWLIKRAAEGQETSALEVSVYETAGGVPGSQVGETITIAGGEVTDKGITTVDLSSIGALGAGKQYALVLGTDEMTDSFERTNGKYDWVKSNSTVITPGDAAGKFNGNGFAAENVGTMYLKVDYIPGSGPEEPDEPDLPPAPDGAVPYDITLEVSNKETLEIGGTTEITATVLDQNGAKLADPQISFASDSTAVSVTSAGDKATVTGAKEGVAKIRVQSGTAVSSVDVYVYDQNKNYTVPKAGMTISKNTALKPGIYNFGGAKTGITIGADDVKVTADYVKIVNADEESFVSDTTTGAYAYQLNAAAQKTAYHMDRELVLSSASSIQLSFDAKAKHFGGSLKVLVSENGTDFTELCAASPLGDWEKTTADLSAYSGKKVTVRLRYETETQIPEDMILLIDTIELFEDNVRTFSDLCEAKPFYYWNISYEDGVKVPDSMQNKPFDRTTCTINKNAFKGTGLVMDGVKGSSVSGITLSGFYWAMSLKDCSGVTVEQCDLSDNYTDPQGGWGDQEGGALLMEGVSKSTIKGNNANNNANALIMRKSNNNTVKGNSFAIASDVCLEMDNSSYNTVEDNDFSWGIRIDAYDEVHARDSTSSLFESGSNYNYICNNDFTHGGDGIFLRPLDGFACEGNIFKGNDTSYANNNAVESWAGRNYYIENKANWSSYGFWMGGSDESEMINNEVAYNGICPHNAPESFGNAGISIVRSNPGSHMKIVGNDIHHNYGPGIALTHTQSWPAYHYLIQNNRIADNVTSAYNSNHVGYAIWMDCIEWADVSGNLMEGNSVNEIHTTENSRLVTVHNGTYTADMKEYEKQVPKASISSDKNVYYVGEEITFSGAGSVDPNGAVLTFRWDMGDGTFAVGETVKHTFTETGYYDVAFTVTNGTWSDIIWLNVNVVQPGDEIGTEEDASAWEFTANGGATTLTNQKPAEGKQREDIPYYTYYTVEGDSSIKMHSTAGNNTITYPASKDAALDFSKDNALSFSMKVQNGAYEGTNHRSPIVRLHTDKDNYAQYQASSSLLAPFYYKEIFAQMQLRQEWVAVTIPYDGSAMWEKSVVGKPDMSKINYISINMENNANNFTFYIDAMKSVSVEKSKANAYVRSIADNSTAICSTAVDPGSADAIHGSALNTSVRWESAAGDEDIWYGVDLGIKRYLDRIDYYLYYEPVGNPSLDTLVLPNSVVAEYEEEGVWKEIPGTRMGKITPNRNTISFKRIKTDKIRIRFNTTDHAPVALYGFRAYNTENYMTELNYENHSVPVITSTVASDVVLDTVEVWGTVNDVSLWDSDIHDLEVYIYHTDASGKGPEGAYVAKGVIRKDSVIPTELPKLFRVEMRDKEGNKASLRAGTKYALLLATERDYNNNGQAHWRFVTNRNVPAGANETFGKVTGQNNDYSSVDSYSVEALGTGWMKIYAENSEEPVIDYSFETNGKSGYGVGAYTEDSRYQTFTIPESTTGSVNNGLINDGWNWSFEGDMGAVFIELNEEKRINLVNIAFEEDGIPSKMVIKNGEKEIAALTGGQLAGGFNEIVLGESGKGILAKNLTFEFTAGDNAVKVAEIELLGDAVDETEDEKADKTRLQAYYDEHKSKKQEDYTEKSWGIFAAALANAKSVLDNADATQTEVNAALMALESAVSALEAVVSPEAVDKTGLQTLYDEGCSKSEAEYTADSFKVFEEAMAAAKAILDNADATQEEVDAGYQNLKNAIYGLVRLATLTELKVTPPDKVEYIVGEEFDKTGLVITAVYSDGVSWDVTEAAELSGYDLTQAGEQTVTVSYQGMTAEFRITVKKPGDQKPGDQKPGDQKPGDQKPGDQKPDGSGNNGSGQTGTGNKTSGTAKAPSTGDPAKLGILILVCTASMFTAAVIIISKKKRKRLAAGRRTRRRF